jgi:hypothetical protein
MIASSNDQGAEALSLLLDMSWLYLDAMDRNCMKALTVPQLQTQHEHLLQSRTLVVLVDLFTKAISVPDYDSDSDSNQFDKLRPGLPRLLQFLTIACLQGPSLASFILRLPSFLSTLRENMSSYDKSLCPTDSLPLLLGLYTAVSTDAKSTIAPELLSAVDQAVDLTLAKIEEASQAQADIVASGDDVDDDNAVEGENNAAASARLQRRKTRIVPGLLVCLQLLASTESGGERVLRNASSVNSAVAPMLRKLASAAARQCTGQGQEEQKRMAKACLSLLDGNSGNKVD